MDFGAWLQQTPQPVGLGRSGLSPTCDLTEIPRAEERYHSLREQHCKQVGSFVRKICIICEPFGTYE